MSHYAELARRARAALSSRPRLARWGAAALLVVLIAAATAALRPRVSPGGAEPVRVRIEDLVMTVETEGELRAVRTTDIGPPQVKDFYDFKIAFLVPESAPVKKGQPIIGFDTQLLQRNLEEKEAEFAEASKQIERREIELRMQVRDLELELAEAEARLGKGRLKDDIPEDLRGRIEARVARLDLEEAQRQVDRLGVKLTSTRAAGEADLRSLRSKRDRAKGRVEELRGAIEAMTIKAPQDGVVIYKTGWRDEKKKVGDSAWSAEKVLELPDLLEMKAEAQVDEPDAGHVAVGQKVILRLDARPDLDFTGRVKSIGSTVSRKSWRVPTKVYRLEVSLDKTDPLVMRPAMRFRGEIETVRTPSLLLAPRDVIFLRPSGPVVWVKKRSGYVETPVTLGRSNNRLVEVLSGVSEGDLLSSTDLRAPEARRGQGPMAGGA